MPGGLLTLIVFALLAFASPAAAQPRWLGFNDSPDAFTEQTLPEAAAVGTNVIRFPIDIDVVIERGLFVYDGLVDSARAQGIRILPSIAGNYAQPPEAVRFVSLLVAQRYEHDLAGIQVWNEPNLFGRMPARAYGRVLAATEEAVHAAYPHIRIVAAGASPNPRAPRYMRRAFTKVPDDARLDVAVHIYPAGRPPARTVMRSVQQIRRITDRRRVWITELGASAADYPGRQGWATVQSYRGAVRADATGVLFHLLLEPHEGIGRDFEIRHRLWMLTRKGERTTVYHALRVINRFDRRAGRLGR